MPAPGEAEAKLFDGRISSDRGNSAIFWAVTSGCSRCGTSPHSSSYLTLRAAYVHFSSAKHGTSRSAVSGMFAFMGSLDRFFLSSSRSAAKRGWEAEIEQLTIQNSYTPSSALASIYDLCSRRFDEERAGLLGQLGAGELALGVAKVVPQDTHVQLFVLRRLGRPVAGYIVQIKSNKLIEVTSCGKVVL